MERHVIKTMQKKRKLTTNKATSEGVRHSTLRNLKWLSSKSESQIPSKQTEISILDIGPNFANTEDIDAAKLTDMSDTDDIMIENLKNKQINRCVQPNSSPAELYKRRPSDTPKKISRIKFKETVEQLEEKQVNNVSQSKGISNKVSESFPLLKMVCEKERKIFQSRDSYQSSSFVPQDILDFLTDSTNFDINLSESFKQEKTAYIETSDPYAKRFYQLMCMRDNVHPLPVILNNLHSRKFELHQYCIYIRMFEIFMETLKHNQKVEVLELIESQIDNQRAALIAKMLEKNIVIFSLNLSRNCIEKEGISALSEVLDASYSVTCLYLSENSLTNRDVAPLIRSLQSNFFLTTLDLSYNNITFENGQEIAACLTNNETLVSLDLRWCLICEKGSQVLAKGLKKNVSLKVLDISWNGLGERGLKNLALALTYNSCLKVINLANNNLTTKSIVHLTKTLKRNKSLEILILDNNCIGDEYTKDFIKLFMKHSSLTLLSLQGVHIDKKTSLYIEELQYLASEDDDVSKIVLHNDFVDMHVLNELLVRSYLKLLFDFIRHNGPSLDALFKSIDKSKKGYLGLETTMQCLEKSGFYIPLKSMKDLIKKLEKENLQKISYSIFFDDTISKLLAAHKDRLKRFAAVAKYL